MQLRNISFIHNCKICEISKYQGAKKGSKNVTNEVDQFFSARFNFIDVI